MGTRLSAWPLCPLLLLVVLVAITHGATEYIVVDTPIGRVRGKTLDNGRGDGSHAVFRGIRFGKYSKRFTVSEVVDKLHPHSAAVGEEVEEVYDALKFGASCPQSNRINIDIWAPLLNGSISQGKQQQHQQHQVMVFIHGGGYIQGSGNDLYIEGKEYAKKGAILVSLNYRLGLFGFFAHPELTAADPENPTNFGLLDQIVALKWIKKYISYFGGDPDDVTVFGESAGANSIQWLMASKDHATAPLFTRAIVQSPPASAYPYDLREAEEHSFSVSDDVLECLRGKSVQDLLVVQWNRKGLPSLSITPLPYSAAAVSTPHADNKNFPVHPAIAGINEIIIGTTKDEWMLFLWLQHLVWLPSDEWMNTAITLIFSSPHFVNQTIPKLGLSERLEELYPRHHYESGVLRVAAIYTDMVFYCPSRNYARKLVTQGANVNFYLFSHEAVHGNRKLKANHIAELPFVFQKTVPSFYVGAVKVFPDQFTVAELALSDSMIDLWLALGKQEKLLVNRTMEWPGYTAEGANLLNISLASSVIRGQFNSEQCEFWNEISSVPQRQIVFDVMAHEPLLLKVVNEYALELAVALVRNRVITLSTLLAIIVVVGYQACCRTTKKGVSRRRKGGKQD